MIRRFREVGNEDQRTCDEQRSPFPKDTILVLSKTDRKGIITYANPAFVAISGYSENELIGRNHSLVRHPDMPPEAFRTCGTRYKPD